LFTKIPNFEGKKTTNKTQLYDMKNKKKPRTMSVQGYHRKLCVAKVRP